ncbi:hypothetical protein [Comamonas sp. JC664]|uniref:hypothetical protein n=1 Tax=Comamonas sp. JC664 TaxID=2801917 RepID=UPI00174DEF3B|nr:hypothetical protein [Comamonas sp. JC664]MBL0695922.1 hypothetical protein [Comamonas sp. JC664]
MQMQTDWRWRSGVLAAVVVLAACNVGGAEEEALPVGQSEAELTCTVSQQCDSGATITCSSASGVCASGADGNGWVECNGSRSYCGAPCTCESQRRTASGAASSFNCPAAWGRATDAALAAASARCPKGLCNVETAQTDCIRNDDNSMTAVVTATFSCMGPPTCQ